MNNRSLGGRWLGVAWRAAHRVRRPTGTGSLGGRWLGLACLVVTVALLALGCSSDEDSGDAVRVLTHQSFHLPEEAIAEFTETTGREVIVYREDTREDVLRLLERTDEPAVVDVVVGIDTLDLRRTIDGGLVQPFVPLAPTNVDPALAVDGNWLLPVSFLDACLVYAPSHFTQPPRPIDQLPDPNEPRVPPRPASFDELTSAGRAPHLVLPDASADRMGLYFLVALAERYPESNRTVDDAVAWPEFFNLMLHAGARVGSNWEDAFLQQFLPDTLSAAELAGIDDGEPFNPLFLPPDHVSISWGSAGMAAVQARHQNDPEAPVDVTALDDGCIRVVNYAGMVAGTPRRQGATMLLDFMTEPLFQYQIGDRFGSRPARPDILRTPAWRTHGQEVAAAELDAAHVGANWEEWRLTWHQVLTNFREGGELIPPTVTVTLPEG